MKYVLDASVALSWVLDDEDTIDAMSMKRTSFFLSGSRN